MPGRFSWKNSEMHLSRPIGFGLIAFGVLVIGSVIAVLVYVQVSRDRLSDIVVQSTESSRLDATPISENQGKIYRNKVQSDPPELYAGQPIPPQFWMDPFWAQGLTPNFADIEFIGFNDASPMIGVPSVPTRLRIPAIGLDSEVIGLGIVDLENQTQYETPKNVVGHIPESSSAGGIGNVWLFGHLESPIRGEGSVFHQLPEVYDFLREGREIFVILDSEQGNFLYQVREFRKIPQEELFLWDLPGRWVTLVTCWPKFKYDERILVIAELVGVNQEGDQD